MANLGLSLYQLQAQKQMQDEIVQKQQNWDREKFYADLAVKRLEEDRKIANAEHLRRLKLAEAYGRMAGIRGEEPPSYEDQRLKDAARLHTELVPAELSLLEMQQGIKQAWRPASYAASMGRVQEQQFGAMNRKVLDIESKEKIAAAALDLERKWHQLQREKFNADQNDPAKKRELAQREEDLKIQRAKLLMSGANIYGKMGASMESTDRFGQQDHAQMLVGESLEEAGMGEFMNLLGLLGDDSAGTGGKTKEDLAIEEYERRKGAKQ